jgi:hypothetical protein
MSTRLAEQILEALQRRYPPAALVTEVTATIRPSPDPSQIEDALRDLGHEGRVLIMNHAAPDVHLTSVDLRVVACVPIGGGESGALHAAEDVWNAWLRAFLSTHRCQ